MKKVKIRKVKDTKNPTIRQLQNMSENLRDHFERYVSITIKTYCHLNSNIKIGFEIYISNAEFGKTGTFQYSDTWSELLQKYYQLMKRKKRIYSG